MNQVYRRLHYSELDRLIQEKYADDQQMKLMFWDNVRMDFYKKINKDEIEKYKCNNFEQLIHDVDGNLMERLYKTELYTIKDKHLNDPDFRLAKFRYSTYPRVTRRFHYYHFKKETERFLENHIQQQDYYTKSYHHISPIVSEDLKQTILNENIKNLSVYRGLEWAETDKDLMNAFSEAMAQSNLYKVKDKLTLNVKDISSWTSDICKSELFAKRNRFKYGIILKMKPKKSDIFADLRVIEYNLNEEQEVILKPGLLIVEIESIYYNNKKVNSMVEWGEIVDIEQ